MATLGCVGLTSQLHSLTLSNEFLFHNSLHSIIALKKALPTFTLADYHWKVMLTRVTFTDYQLPLLLLDFK